MSATRYPLAATLFISVLLSACTPQNETKQEAVSDTDAPVDTHV